MPIKSTFSMSTKTNSKYFHIFFLSCGVFVCVCVCVWGGGGGLKGHLFVDCVSMSTHFILLLFIGL